MEPEEATRPREHMPRIGPDLDHGPVAQARTVVATGFQELEDENAKLKRLVADLSLDKAILQDVLRKKV